MSQMDETEVIPPTGCGSCLQESGSKSLVWKFVGEGQGTFAPVQNYEYVGSGRGTYEKEVVVTPGRWNMRKVLTLLALPCGVALMVLLLIWSVTALRARHASRKTVTYSCDELGVLVNTWSATKREWCCANLGRGCPTTPDGCNQDCTYLGKTGSCAYRIQWGADHRFLNQPAACQQAHQMVLGQCSVCRACALELSNCHAAM